VRLRIALADLHSEMERVLLSLGFAVPRAALSARLFAEASLDGVASHGLNRFPRFVGQVKAGLVQVDAAPRRVERFGAWEQWDGEMGPGNLNAHSSAERAMALAREQGIGCVALRNTNHWMRGGSYGWQAASAGHALLAWTNTMPNMPPWGARSARVGNNPLVVAIPRGDAPVVLDMAMSQFSYGRLEALERQAAPLSVPGGFDEAGLPTTDPGAILRSGRVLPIGYWKGSSLALVLDLLATLLSGGRSTSEIEPSPEREVGLSQVFIAVDLTRAGSADSVRRRVSQVIEDLVSAAPVDPASPVRYPGEQVLRTRLENLRLGVPVDEAIWERVRSL
jgi:3-dehydro-L-gulonate 2-dehydrogenase